MLLAVGCFLALWIISGCMAHHCAGVMILRGCSRSRLHHYKRQRRELSRSVMHSSAILAGLVVYAAVTAG